jgi:hypothetical protein
MLNVAAHKIDINNFPKVYTKLLSVNEFLLHAHHMEPLVGRKFDSWLRHYPTSQKVTDSTPDDVIEFLQFN